MNQPLRMLTLLSSLVVSLLFSPGAAEAQGTFPGNVAWARLRTDYRHWNRHANAETAIVEFIATHTDLQISPRWEVAEIGDLESLIQYPFLFAEGIHIVKTPEHRANLREYLLRGGFIFIDACINPSVNSDPDVFLARHLELFQAILPGSVATPVPEDSELMEAFFRIEGGVPHSYMHSIYDPEWAKHGLYGIYFEGRPVALISLSGLKCGWTGLQEWEGHDVLCSQMMVNIYIWAMTR